MSTRPLEIKGTWGKYSLPQIGEALLPLSLGLGGTTVAPVSDAVALAGAPAALAGTSAALAGSSNDGPVAGASTPTMGAFSTAASAARGDRGEGFHLSGGLAPCRSSPPTMSSLASQGESPCCSRSRYSSLSCSCRSRRWTLLSFARAAPSCSRRCAARAAVRARGVGGSDHVASTVTLY
jgi:hypothetical protein